MFSGLGKLFRVNKHRSRVLHRSDFDSENYSVVTLQIVATIIPTEAEKERLDLRLNGSGKFTSVETSMC